jgi:hypothetical protein
VILKLFIYDISIKKCRPNGGFGGVLATKVLERHNKEPKGDAELPPLGGHFGGGELVVKPALAAGFVS